MQCVFQEGAELSRTGTEYAARVLVYFWVRAVLAILVNLIVAFKIVEDVRGCATVENANHLGNHPRRWLVVGQVLRTAYQDSSSTFHEANQPSLTPAYFRAGQSVSPKLKANVSSSVDTT